MHSNEYTFHLNVSSVHSVLLSVIDKVVSVTKYISNPICFFLEDLVMYFKVSLLSYTYTSNHNSTVSYLHVSFLIGKSVKNKISY